MRHRESNIQIQCVRYFTLQYPEYTWRTADGHFGSLLNSVPNGGHRSATEAAIMKAEGVVPGVADLELNIARGGYHGLKIEMKTDTGRQSPSQKAWQTQIEAQGYKYAVCRSFDEFVKIIENYLGT